MDTSHRTETPDLIEVLGLADAATLADLDMLSRVARMLTGADGAFISFADADHLWPVCAGRTRGDCKPLNRAYCSALLAGEENNFISHNVLLDPRTQGVTRQAADSKIVSYAGALLRAEDGRKLGTLCVTDSAERDFEPEQIELLNGLARQVMNLVSLRASKRELTSALASMTELARTDALTGLLNRRAWLEEAEALRKLVQRQSGCLTLAVLDLDHFKQINDSLGHAAGDAVLRDMGRLLKTQLRETDRVGRIGGEEFAIAMPFTTKQAATARLEQLRRSIAGHQIVHDGGRLTVTVSCGVADLWRTHSSIDSAMRGADRALYRAKGAGRNQIEWDAPAEQIPRLDASRVGAGTRLESGLRVFSGS